MKVCLVWKSEASLIPLGARKVNKVPKVPDSVVPGCGGLLESEFDVLVQRPPSAYLTSAAVSSEETGRSCIVVHGRGRTSTDDMRWRERDRDGNHVMKTRRHGQK